MSATEELGRVISSAMETHLKTGGKRALMQAAGTVAGFKFLLERIEKLEALPFEYAGIHESQKRYFKNQFVTHGGRVWACVVDYTIQQPGTSEDWKLAVNKGPRRERRQMNLQQRIHERINDLEARHPGMFDLTVSGFSVAPSKRGAGLGQSLYVSTADASGIGFELPLLPGDDVTTLRQTLLEVVK